MAKKILITAFYRLGVCSIPKAANSDFLDVLVESKNADVFYVALCDEDSSVVLYHNDKGAKIIECDQFEEALDDFLDEKLKNSYPAPILKPLLNSAFLNDPGELEKAFNNDEFSFYSAAELDDVEQYKSTVEGADSIFVIGSVSYGIDAYIDIKSHQVEMNGEVYENLSDLFGEVDESDTWVVVLRPGTETSASPTSSKKSKALNQLENKGSEFCTECGSQVSPNSKFCGDCGTAVQGIDDVSKPAIPSFRDSVIELDSMSVDAAAITAEGPDSEGNYSITVKYTVENTTSHDFDLLLTHVALINSDGFVIDERDTTEDELAAGGNSEFESYFWNIPEGLIGANPEKLGVMIEITGCSGSKQDLGVFDLPSEANRVIAIPTFVIDEKIRGFSGSIWKSLPDSDKDVTVNTKISLQNLTDEQFSQVKLSAKVLNSKGEEILDVSGSEDLKPSSINVLGGYGYEKEKSLKSAKLECSISYAKPVAKSFLSHIGSDVVSEEPNQFTSGAFASLAEALGSRYKRSASSDEGVTEIAVRFALTKGEGVWPAREELSDEEVNNPSKFCLFNLSLEDDVGAEIESCEVIYDGVTYSETLDEGIQVTDDSVEGYPTPIIKFYLSNAVAPSEFVKKVWMSTVSLKPKSRENSQEDPFYCEDMNGYTEFVSEEQVDEISEQLATDGLFFGKSFSPTDLDGADMSEFRSDAKTAPGKSETNLEPKECGGSFEINVFGRGGETVVGRISKAQFEYWDEHRDDLDDHFSGGGDDVDDGLSLGEWSDLDDVAHCAGADFSTSQSRIQVTDAAGNEIWSIDADRDFLEENGIEVELQEEMAIYQLEPGYYFCGRSFEKGSFFSSTVDADVFDPKKIKFLIRDVNEWILLVGVFYDGEELDGSDGYSTSTYSSEFFVEESES